MSEYAELKPVRNDEATDGRETSEGALEEQEEPNPIPTPPNEEEPYTLTAYGDISLSDIDYVPGPPSEISPSQATKKESWRRVPRNDSESMRRFPSITGRVRPPSLSKGRTTEVKTFDELMMDLKRDAEKPRLLSKGTSALSGKVALEVDGVQIHSPQPKHLIDVINLGDEIGVENHAPSMSTAGPIQCNVDSRDENGASAKRVLRGNGKFCPKRPPIPRWDIDNYWQYGILCEASTKLAPSTKLGAHFTRLVEIAIQFMSFGTKKCVADEEGDWEIISARHWWHTPINAAHWSFSPRQRVVESTAPRRQFRGSLFCEKNSVDLHSRSSSKERRTPYDDDSLNVELDGVKSAMETLTVYERDVGFNLDIQIAPLVSQGAIDLQVAVDQKDLLDRKKLWDELLEDLMTGPAFDNDADGNKSLESSFIGEDLRRSTSTISSIGTSFSERSIESIGMPSTPKPKSSYNDVEIKDLSPTGSVNGSVDYYLSPCRSLNASASSFVPSFCPPLNGEPLEFPSLDPCSPHASFANFTFPTLNTPLPPEINRNDDAFYSESQMESSATSLLPPFLQQPPSQRNRSRKSRTREIVDRLRSRVSPDDAISRKFASHSSSPTPDRSNAVTPRLSVSEDGSGPSTPSCEEEGWIDLTSSSPTQKARRTRELFLALTRRRTDSLSSENVKDTMVMGSETSPNSPQPPSLNVSSESSPSTHSPLSLAASIDGWIDTVVPPLDPQKESKQPSNSSKDSSQQRSRKKSSNHASRASISSSNSYYQHPHHPNSHGVSLSSSSPTSQHYPNYLHQFYQHSYHQYHHASSPSTFSVTSPYLPHKQHKHHSSITAAPAAMPYFFPAYPAVAMPVPFTAFMHMPATATAYHIPGTIQPMHVGLHPPMYGSAVPAAQQPAPMQGSLPSLSTTKLSSPS